ncbi:6905_t:CDS:2, partial [Dentiscutata erythropus]
MPPKAEEEMLMNENFKMKEPYPTLKPVEVPLPYCVDHEKMILKPATNPLWNFTLWCTITSTVLVCKICTSSYTVYNQEPFVKTSMDPNRTRPILTVSNHLSTLDDPLFWGSIPFKNFLSLHRARWTL